MQHMRNAPSASAVHGAEAAAAADAATASDHVTVDMTPSGSAAASAAATPRRGYGGAAAQLSADFSALFDAIVPRLHEPATLLLLYNLLVRCAPFLESVLVRSDIDALLLPLLRQLYDTTAERTHHLYLLQVRLRSGAETRQLAGVLPQKPCMTELHIACTAPTCCSLAFSRSTA